MKRTAPLACVILFAVCVGPSSPVRAGEADFAGAAPLLRRFCFECHGKAEAEGHVNLRGMLAEPSVAESFKTWQKVAAAVEQKKMPPEDARQPSDQERAQLALLVRGEIDRVAKERAGAPGQVVMRRLTSAEYTYTLEDLTGLDFDLDREFVGDAVGGEGFANIGIVQFVHDATIERYLEAAKKVASHAVIGAGPLQFYKDPGKTGFELSAINRINDIYRANGFRTAAGEGAEPFGLDQYTRAFYASWRYLHRERLGLKGATLASLAADEKLNPRFVEHIWSVLAQSNPTFPTAEIVMRWHAFPTPDDGDAASEEKVRAACENLYKLVDEWQDKLADAAGDREEAPLLSEDSFKVVKAQEFRAAIAGGGGVGGGAGNAGPTKLNLTVALVNPHETGKPMILWRNARLRTRGPDGGKDVDQPLSEVLSEADATALGLGRHPSGAEIGPNDFVTSGAVTKTFEVKMSTGTRRADLVVDAEVDLVHGDDCVVRCSVARAAGGFRRRAFSVILADPEGAALRSWKGGVLEFARNLPQSSHREPAPSDRDRIPLPYDNTYNARERDYFHYRVKYSRDDRFIVEHMLDDAARVRLNDAWIDLLGSFEFHDANLHFLVEKYRLDLGGRGVADLDDAQIASLPEEPQRYVRALRDSYLSVQHTLKDAQSRHVADALQFASRAWRRPLTDEQRQRLVAFYNSLRKDAELDHASAVRALLVRILVAPEFLYRAERPAGAVAAAPLSDWELASRLSYFLWSSQPDDELRRAAAAGELRDPERRALQARRMLRDPRSRRFATEFFGQWFGFYQFDRYRGVDPERFPEFTDALKSALYEEAIGFFEHIVREDRPVGEMLFADYAFLNKDLAKHYAIEAEVPEKGLKKLEKADQFHRGGLLSLGAVLTTTSAPLRTSPVKRGDWILRRVMGTPVPPPPADAGSISPDEGAGGQTIREQLDVHRRNATCANCHSRIDPLGFALEHYDPLGRWRDQYREGQKIEDSGTLEDGTVVAGREGLNRYLKSQQPQFERTLCTKLIGYALGRVETVADAVLVDEMLAELKADGRLSNAIAKIVASPQFGTIESTSLASRQTSGNKAPSEQGR